MVRLFERNKTRTKVSKGMNHGFLRKFKTTRKNVPTPHPAVIATSPLKLPFIAILKSKMGSPNCLSRMNMLTNKAVKPAIPPDSVVFTAESATSFPRSLEGAMSALPELKPYQPNHKTNVPSICRKKTRRVESFVLFKC